MEEEFYDIELDNLESKSNAIIDMIYAVNLVKEYLKPNSDKKAVLEKYSSKVDQRAINEVNQDYFQKIDEMKKGKMTEIQKTRLEGIIKSIINLED